MADEQHQQRIERLDHALDKPGGGGGGGGGGEDDEDVDDVDDSFISSSNELLPSPPDGGWGWLVVFASFMIHVVADGIAYSFGNFVVELMEVFGDGRGAVSLIPSILVGVTLSIGPVASSLTNRYGCRSVTILGALIGALGLAVSAFSPSLIFLYLSIGVLTGIGFGFIYLPAIVSVSMYFEKRRAFATGIAVCGSGLGTFVMSPLTRILIDSLSWSGAILVVSGLVLTCVGFGLLFKPLNSESDDAREGVEEEEDRENSSKDNNEEVQDEKLEIDQKSSKQQQNRQLTTLPEIKLNGEVFTPLGNQFGNGYPGSSDSNPKARIAFSHPVMSLTQSSQVPKIEFGSHSQIYQSPKKGHDGHHHHHLHSHKHAGAGVMFRKDILYGGSLHNIPEYKTNPRKYSRQIARLQLEQQHEAERQSCFESQEDINKSEECEEGLEDQKVGSSQLSPRTQMSSKICGCVPVSAEVSQVFNQMMDFSLFKDPIFIMFAVSNFLTSIGFNVPYVYTVDRALLIDIDKDDASFLVAVIGMANTLGRIILGYISDKTWMNRLYLYNMALATCGIAICLSNFCFDYVSQVIYCSVFGVTSGAYVGLTSVVLVDLLTLDKLTNAFGLLMLFQGVASVLGPPIIGWLYDVTGSYDVGFYFAGSMIFVSGVMLFALPTMIRKKNLQTKNSNERNV